MVLCSILQMMILKYREIEKHDERYIARRQQNDLNNDSKWQLMLIVMLSARNLPKKAW